MIMLYGKHETVQLYICDMEIKDKTAWVIMLYEYSVWCMKSSFVIWKINILTTDFTMKKLVGFTNQWRFLASELGSCVEHSRERTGPLVWLAASIQCMNNAPGSWTMLNAQGFPLQWFSGHQKLDGKWRGKIEALGWRHSLVLCGSWRL